MQEIPDHPIIRNMERTGYPDGKEPEYFVCPICSEETDTIYVNLEKRIVGCDNCVETRDAWEIIVEEDNYYSEY